jgi:ankyrin repeat protein
LGADVNAQGGKYGSALQAAAAAPCSNEVMVRLLLDSGADVNAQGGEHGSVLQAAVAKGNKVVVQQLLDSEAN